LTTQDADGWELRNFGATNDAQVLIDATDASGRCHDSMLFGGVPEVGVTDKKGGLEIIDIKDPAQPKEIGLTSHVGEAHTVNVDPKRPHIAYAVTSDAVSVSEDRRTNSTGGTALDGFEGVDIRSCPEAPYGTNPSFPNRPLTADQLAAKRDACRPEVYRYRYPELKMVHGHTNKGMIYGCHELEIYPNDRLSCAGGSAMPIFDMSGAFDDRGTPDDFTDDKPRGTPLPCSRRATASQVFKTEAQVVDCVDGKGLGTDDLIDKTPPGVFIGHWLSNRLGGVGGYAGLVRHLDAEKTLPELDPLAAKQTTERTNA
jgi:hypothetical protein